MLSVRQIASEPFTLLSYVVTDPGTGESLVVDPSAGMAGHVDIGSLRVNAVVNTHIHPDHTAGDRLFADKAPVLAHSGDGRFFHRAVYASLSVLLTARITPKISFTLSEGSTLMVGTTPIRVMHTPGHSPGSICLSWPGNLITGDTVFVEGIGRTDIPGGSLPDIRQSVLRILALPEETRIWPGHYYGGRYTATLREIGPSLRRIAESIRQVGASDP